MSWWFSKQKTQLDPEATYLRVQFLTAEEKATKREKVAQLQKEYQNNEEEIVPYMGAFAVSFQFVLNTAELAEPTPIRHKIQLKELECHLKVTKDKALEDFLNTYVKQIQLYEHNGSMVSRNDCVPLVSEFEIDPYQPHQVLEVIYKQNTFWERLKTKTKKVIKDIPGTLMAILLKLLRLLFGEFGAKSLMWKMVPTSSIVQYFVYALSIFFPMLAPFLQMGSKILL